MRQEVTLSVYSPYEDRGAEATFEGDRIRLLPLTLREFIDIDALEDPSASVEIPPPGAAGRSLALVAVLAVGLGAALPWFTSGEGPELRIEELAEGLHVPSVIFLHLFCRPKTRDQQK